ncbi:unnamed protein product [Boreogadus saida]
MGLCSVSQRRCNAIKPGLITGALLGRGLGAGAGNKMEEKPKIPKKVKRTSPSGGISELEAALFHAETLLGCMGDRKAAWVVLLTTLKPSHTKATTVPSES